MKGGVLCACNLLLASFKNQLPVSGLCVEFSKGEPSLQLNGQFTSNGLHEMQEGKEYRCISMVLSSICACMGKATKYIENTALRK